MGFGDDEEILQDFLVEAGEILENLSEQLVELERQPDDRELLNAIFRGFHTVKGGAGFLQLNAMVECCHVTENLFDILRNGKREVTSELMDVVLQALDAVNLQFEQVSQREELTAADPELLSQLEKLVACEDLNGPSAAPADDGAVPSESQSASPDTVRASSDITDDEFNDLLDALSGTTAGQSTNEPSGASTTAATTPDGSSDEISEDEFDALLDQLHGAGQAPGAAAPSAPSGNSKPATSSDEISDDEFEALLDELHGKGKAPTKTAGSAPAESTPAADSSEPAKAAGASDDISDDEFEALLDQIHGKGKGPQSNAAQDKAPAPTPSAKPKVELAPKASASQAQAKSATPGGPQKGRPEREGAPAQVETTVRVDTQRLDEIMNMVGELVLVRNRLVRLGDSAQNESLSKAVSNLDVVTADLQSSVMKTRMQPIKKVFGRFPRVVRDLARNLKKEIDLELVGEETDLDKNLVEALADPLVHLVRNSVDHGIELPEIREQKGKPRKGCVVLGAEQEGDHILLSITDDGAGMDPDKLRKIAVEKGVYDEDTVQRLSDSEAFALIFAPGFSTKKEISDVSGRGVGMDVVKTKITQLNGSIEIQSKLGEGTRFNIKVPLTLAIMPTLMIMLENQTFALPLVSVNEIFHMDLTRSHVVDGQECVAIRDQAIPLFFLKNWLINGAHVSTKNQKEGHVVIVTVGTRRVGFVVDQLIGQEEVVIKPLGKMLQGTPGMAGATITGDGTIALILDVPSLLQSYSNGA
ncbi:chemotaxis protein CheA [Gilvimarinus agarilyticus]|uniref:chemotaxis protein CheA n=1 Tax=unclassified Gilvimarinus TaxID=2642066 RepID=UPI001C08EA1D|nr:MULTISPECIES: chemotaxis protein CheA [unclassified Gilvimarinus]MBU2887215.1 chemotaxis protein CheA [Gilvimarinus agarilyticus]MDO6571874.1 chemotaxis protein CheA [Gilvimarinus sp. 2_MG-2023]MDO6745943.1 chemotaxis protein CheA [Gilvimarinus sp. 1_MG-2023]